jgi:transposase InsO family protein
MTERDPTGRTLDEEGIPDLEGPLPEKAATGDGQEGVPPPSDRPASLDWGTTLREQRLGEPISVRVNREEPDTVEGAPGADEGLRLVAPEDEDVGLTDTEKEETARAVDEPGLMLSAEEAAMHVTERLDALTLWLEDYNWHRPHSAIGNHPPAARLPSTT